jgi:hypothetical protein
MGGDARKTFLAGLIDDAGLFPPASLSMDDAVAAHQASREGENGWMLSRFICPASRLPELAKQIAQVEAATPWRISVILDTASGERWLDGGVTDLSAARDFTSHAGGGAKVELLEGVLPPALEAPLLRKFVDAVESGELPSPVSPYFELPGSAPIPETLRVIAEVRDGMNDANVCLPPGAKLRCGGASEDLFPTPARVASFIHHCNRLGIPFKATAGLHHPFRHLDAATGFVQHGFVNLVGAAILSSAGQLGERQLEELIADENPASFSVTPQGVSWRDHSASESEIAAARGSLFTSYGSCSFAEPVEDLTALGILPL